MPKKAPEALADLREQIDGIDDRIIALLNERAALARKVGAVKVSSAQRAYAPERERALLERVRRQPPGPLPDASLRLIYKKESSARRWPWRAPWRSPSSAPRPPSPTRPPSATSA